MRDPLPHFSQDVDQLVRIKACGQVVLFFANTLGYAAKEAISRAELENLIDSGIEPIALAEGLWERIEKKSALVLGYHPIGNLEIPVRLPDTLRKRHIYIIGKSGSGKTTLIRNLILQDLDQGHGIGVIAPEQELITEEILPFVPPCRWDDVIYVNPADTERSVSFNPLSVDEDEDLDFRVDETLGILKALLEQLTGPRMEEILRQTLYTLMQIPGSTLLDVDPLLDRRDSTFRRRIVKKLKDHTLIHFWTQAYPSYPKDAHLPITTRLGRIIRPKVVRNLICQPGPGLNMRETMDHGKILLFNLSDGILGPLAARLIGQLIVSKIQLAALSRADLPKARRRPFYLYIDEFQAFTSTASASYETILSRARKYGLGLILAHQQTGQIPPHLLKEILGNVTTIISFSLSADDASRLAKEFVTDWSGEILRLDANELLALRTGEAWCRIGRYSFPMRTYPPPSFGSAEVAEQIIQLSRQRYGWPVRIEGHQVQQEQRCDIEEIDPGKVF